MGVIHNRVCTTSASKIVLLHSLTPKLDKGQQECLKNCFKNFAFTLKYGYEANKAHSNTARANPHI
jgi:hypothetical protein